jgi:hypothetical protein
MSSIVRNKVGRYTYLYESESYRNEEGKPRNRRVLVGRIDPKTGLPVYKQEYIDRMRAQGIEVESAQVSPEFSVEDVRRSSIVRTGMVHLLRGISDQIGLSPVLHDTFPSLHERIFALASYLVCSGEPVAYCADWVERSDIEGVGSMSSQRVSELLRSVTVSGRERFYDRWAEYRSELEYLALDITSVSSWSQLIDDVEWGYNRDGDALPQVNLCMLMGQESHLPVRMTVYSGSIRDVSTLETTLGQLWSGGEENILIVMDKGFSSRKNINVLLRRKDIRFLIALPMTMSFAISQLEAERGRIDSLQNTIVSGAEVLRGVSKERVWSDGRRLYVHVFYNDMKAAAVKNSLYGHVRRLVEAAMADPDNGTLKKQFERYLIIRRSKKREGGYTVNIREDVVEKEIARAGWLVTVSNHISDAEEAIAIYRAKDVVEKGFMRLKGSLGLDRLRVHSQEAMESKVFVGFIALILMSHIHRVMITKGLYDKMTMKDLIRTMEKLRTQVIDDRRILFPLTRRQKDIYRAFDIAPPV